LGGFDADLLQEVVALIVDDDEGRDVQCMAVCRRRSA
jgi:hypothetical protein